MGGSLRITSRLPAGRFVLNPSEPFNDEGNYPDLIIAAERTQQFAPEEILEEFGTDEWLGGWPNDAAVSTVAAT